ncbi:TPA: hypothetical protein HA278_07820 [Candidatus Woesearchaeota archaeon]|nr:hypothetical protein [Candidatus Woesearchaeota archaeon]|tara:strand:- start:242 stop:706 length:465 start_codon:yes stop_codon:yes gene_type:complete
MKKTLALLIVSLFLVGCSSFTFPTATQLCQKQGVSPLGLGIVFASSQMENQPVHDLVGDQTAVLYVRANKDPICKGKILAYTITISDGKVQSITSGEPSNPTMVISTTESVLTSVVKDNPDVAIKNALSTGQIQVHGIGILNKIRVWIMKATLT